VHGLQTSFWAQGPNRHRSDPKPAPTSPSSTPTRCPMLCLRGDHAPRALPPLPRAVAAWPASLSCPCSSNRAPELPHASLTRSAAPRLAQSLCARAWTPSCSHGHHCRVAKPQQSCSHRSGPPPLARTSSCLPPPPSARGVPLLRAPRAAVHGGRRLRMH